MSDKGYTVIPDWMLDLDLDIYEVIILAVIYGFSQDGESSFTGSWGYLARKAKCSRSKVSRTLPKLIKMGLIAKNEVNIKGLNLCEYRWCLTDTGGVPETRGGSVPERPNNIDIEIIDGKKYNKKAVFNFKSALLSIGVSEEVADAWIAVRKTKRATNTEIAFRKVAEEIRRSGKTANECITIAVENSWQGFKAEWLDKPSRQPRQKESVFAHNLKVMDQMYGTHMYDEAYGRRQTDEQ